jgi:menaquinone-9 beta-reductase
MRTGGIHQTLLLSHGRDHLALSEHFDLIVAGGGPAGSATATIAARAGRRVLLLEKSKFPRHKVCGEFISAESVEILRTLLGSAAPAVLGSAPEVSTAELYIAGERIAVRLRSPAVSISRLALDQALWNAAINAGVVVRENTAVRSMARSSEFVAICNGAEFTATAVVNATGRWSELNDHTESSGRIGFKAHFAEAAPRAGVQLYFFDGGYCGIQAVSTGVINVCGMAEKRMARDLEALLQRHPALYERSRGWQQITEAVATYPLAFRAETPTTGLIINVGDAAAFVDPFIGDGISIALQTGVLAGQLLCATPDVRAAAAQYERAYKQHVRPVLRRASQLRQLGRSASLRSLGAIAMRSSYVREWALNTTRARLRLDLRNAI